MSLGRHSQKRAAKWPFWLLVAAWWCANTPQAATFEMILWLKGAASFSHQAELKADVAAILSGVPKVAPSHHGQIGRETPPPTVPLAKTVTIKRVSLCLHEQSMVADGPIGGVTMRRLHDRVPERRTTPPQLRPPRLA